MVSNNLVLVEQRIKSSSSKFSHPFVSHATLKTICTLCNTNTYLHNIHKRGFCVIVGNIVNVIYASTFATKLMKQQLDEIISESAFTTLVRLCHTT